MHSFISTVASTALLLSSLTSAVPVVSPVPATNLPPTNPEIILGPVRATKLSDAASLVQIGAAAAPGSKTPTIVPKTDVVLQYASSSGDAMTASINATMKYPAILLEEIDSISKVDCSENSVAITFSDKEDYDETAIDWPASDFVLFTNHLGDCDVDNERGLYIVNSVTRNDDNLTVTAGSTKSSFDNSTSHMTIDFSKPVSAKRAVTDSWSSQLPDNTTLDLNTVAPKSGMVIAVKDPKIGGDISVSGHVDFSWTKLKPTAFYIDIDVGFAASARVEVSTDAPSEDSPYDVALPIISVAAFRIPGILSLGPSIVLRVGAEFGAAAAVDVTADFSANMPNGRVHIDLLDSNKSVSTGFEPVFTDEIKISPPVKSHFNPYFEVTARMAASFLMGLLDLSAGVTARPSLTNDFTPEPSQQAQVTSNNQVTSDNQVNKNNTYTSDNTYSATPPASPASPASPNTTCASGLINTKGFSFDLKAFVTEFYEVEIYHYATPIDEPRCYTEKSNTTVNATA